MAYVLRVENSLGRGPYVGCRSNGWAIGDHNDYAHPAPDEEYSIRDTLHKRGLVFTKEFYCGFNSFEQLCAWFLPVELDNLIYLDFHVSCYFVEDEHYIAGEKQIIFKKEQATLIDTKSLSICMEFGNEKI